MPSGDFSRPTKPRKKISPPKKKTPPKTTAPVTDAQSSGSDYGTRKANRYKNTPKFKRDLAAAKPSRKTDASSSGKGYGLPAAQKHILDSYRHAPERIRFDIATGRTKPVIPYDVARALGKKELAKLKTAGVGSPVLTILNQLARPSHAIAGAFDALNPENATKSGYKVDLGKVGHQFTQGLIENKPYSFGKIFKRAGLPGAVAGVAGFGFDVATDPTTYLTFGTGSVARHAAASAGESAAKAALKAGASPKLAEHAGAQAAKEAAAKATATSKGLSVKFAGHEIPGVTRATAKAASFTKRQATKTPGGVRRAAAGTKAVAREVRPQIKPSGVPELQHEAIRRAGRKARSSARVGMDRKTQRALGLADRLSPKDHELLIHALDTGGDIGALPERLQDVARFLKKEYADAHLEKRRAGIPVGKIEGYHPHARKDKLEGGDGIVEDTRMPTQGPRAVGSHARQIKRPMLEVNAEHRAKHGEDLFSTNVPLVYANYMREHAKQVATAQLARDLGNAGEHIKVERAIREVPKRGVPVPKEPGKRVAKILREIAETQDVRVAHVRDLRPGEAIYHVGVRDGKFGIHEVTPAQVGRVKGRYVILNKHLVDEQLNGITHGTDRTAIGALFDRGTGAFKRIATGTLAFHARNLVGDTQMAYLAQPGHRLATNAGQAGKAIKRLSKMERAQRELLGRVPPSSATVKVAGKAEPLDSFIQGALDHGVVRSGYIGRELEELKGVGKDLGSLGGRKVPRVVSKEAQNTRKEMRTIGARHGIVTPEVTLRDTLKRWMQNREDLMRLATYKHGLDVGMSKAEAADLSLNAHIDYGDLTKFERNVARRAFPFYTFSSRALPIHAKALVTRPGKFATYEKAREEAGTATGVDTKKLEAGLKEFQARQAPFILNIGGKRTVVSDALPLTLLNELPVSTDPTKYLKELFQWTGSMLNPVVKDIYELGANRSLFFRSDIENKARPLVSAPDWAGWLYKHDRGLADKLGVVPDYFDKRTGRKVPGWPGTVDYVFKAVPGLPNVLQQLTTKGSNRRGQTQGQKVFAAVTGVKAEPLDPEGALMEELFPKLDEVTKQLGALNQRGVKAANATPEYKRLSEQEKTLKAALTVLSKKRGDKVPLFTRTTGAPSVRKPNLGDGGLGDGIGSKGLGDGLG